VTRLIDPRKEFGRAVTRIAEINSQVVVLSADSGGSSGFGEFARTHPERYFEFGIMEQGVTGIAAGLATTGLIPVFAAIAPFVTSRNFEMFRNDLGYMRQNVKIVGRNGGFTYADLGATHHSLEDYAITRMIPGVVVFAPSDPGEIRGCAQAMIDHTGPTYMRIGAQGLPDLFEEQPIRIGRGRLVRQGGDVTVVSTGYITTQAVSAVQRLTGHGCHADLISMPTPSHLDAGLICASAARTGAVVSVEEHYEIGGLGGAVAELLSAEQPTRLLRIGVPHRYQPSGPYPGLLQHAGLDAAAIAARIQAFLAR